MEAKGFFSSLFDYSFSSFITPKIIKVLYVLLTIAVSLWTLALILISFSASSGLGILMLLVGGPIFFVIAMIYVRVALELAIVFFRIHADVEEINRRGGGTGRVPPVSPAAPTEPGPVPAPAAAPLTAGRFCDNCGAERSPGKRFCQGCGEPLE